VNGNGSVRSKRAERILATVSWMESPRFDDVAMEINRDTTDADIRLE